LARTERVVVEENKKEEKRRKKEKKEKNKVPPTLDRFFYTPFFQTGILAQNPKSSRSTIEVFKTKTPSSSSFPYISRSGGE